MNQSVIRFVGRELAIAGSPASATTQHAILRGEVLVIDWEDSQGRQVLVKMTRLDGIKWIGSYERGSNPKEEGSAVADVLQTDTRLTIYGTMESDSGGFSWAASFERVDRFPTGK